MRASSSAALLTGIALCPAFSSAAWKRSRTNAVSSATTTVLAVTEDRPCETYRNGAVSRRTA